MKKELKEALKKEIKEEILKELKQEIKKEVRRYEANCVAKDRKPLLIKDGLIFFD